jgi:arsenate reductase
MNNGVLFVCSHNSARSQMAEGLLRTLASDRFDVYSAGVEPGTLNPLAVKALAELGIDISHHQAEGINKYLGRVPIYTLIIVCDKAAQTCPRIWPGARETLHWYFDDPAAASGSEEEKLAAFRTVRDQIKAKLEAWLAESQPSEAPAAAGA